MILLKSSVAFKNHSKLFSDTKIIEKTVQVFGSLHSTSVAVYQCKMPKKTLQNPKLILAVL